MLGKSIVATTALVASALAAQTATVVLESGSGSNAQNSTVTIAINGLFDNMNELSGVTALYLTDSTDVALDTVTCTPFSSADGTDAAARAFDSTTPSHLSSNDVVRSIVCISTGISHSPMAPPAGGSSSTTTTTSSPDAPKATSTTPEAATATAGGSAAESTGNSASALHLPSELFGLLALGGFGVAFAI